MPAAAAASGLGPSTRHVDRAPGSEDLQHPLGQEMIRDDGAVPWALGMGWVWVGKLISYISAMYRDGLS